MRLTAYVNGIRVGWFTQIDGRAITLEYDRAWQQRPSRVELSLSMPKTRRQHDGNAPGHYLWNLLPDSAPVLRRWATRFGVSLGSPMGLLGHVGLDAAGAVQLLSSDSYDEPELSESSGVERLSEADIAAHLRQLRRDPSAWMTVDDDGGYFSLAGAQSKFTLARTADGWGVPTGRGASTHIVKPGVVDLGRSDLNEHLTMRAAGMLGLNVAPSRMMRFEDQTAIVITRFDRARLDDSTVVRRHQEDLAQAMGVHPASKYQSDGGPGIADVGQLLRRHLGRSADAQIARFFEAVLFNWAALGTDAHVKNYAIVHPARSEVGTARGLLAPLYDLGSALAYPDLNNRKAKLAMSFAGHYRAFEIEPRHLVEEGEPLGLSRDWVLMRARDLVDGLPDALSQAAQEAALTGDDALFAGALVDRARERTDALRRQLDRLQS